MFRRRLAVIAAAGTITALCATGASAIELPGTPEYPEFEVPSGAVTSAQVVEVQDCRYGVRTRAEVTYDSGITYKSTLSPTLRWLTAAERAAAGCSEKSDLLHVPPAETVTEAYWDRIAAFDRADFIGAIEVIGKREVTIAEQGKTIAEQDKTITRLAAKVSRRDDRIFRLLAKIERLRAR
jgi:uncharacterized coiled-coil protein SlyX